jgi:hypothetical protein
MTMGEIKSAYELAMERVERMGEATEEEKLRWKYQPEGEKLAALYLEEEINLASKLSEYDNNTKGIVVDTLLETLIANINLVKNDAAKRRNKRAMEGIKIIKNDKVAVENVFSNMRALFNQEMDQGDQQRQHIYQSMKEQFRQQMIQVAQQQYGPQAASMNIDVDNNPQFREQLNRVMARMESGYIKQLDEYKKELKRIK